MGNSTFTCDNGVLSAQRNINVPVRRPLSVYGHSLRSRHIKGEGREKIGTKKKAGKRGRPLKPQALPLLPPYAPATQANIGMVM